jgi:hypothetical protein
MVSRPLVAGILTGWVVGDPVSGLLLGCILEVYFISIFPVGGAEFPEGGPPTLVAVAVGSTVSGPGGVALGVALGLVLSRVGALSIHLLRRVNGRLIPNPSVGTVSAGAILGGHLAGMSLDFLRGFLLSLFGLLGGTWLAQWTYGIWPLRMPGTLTLIAIGGTLTAGAFVGSLGGWRRRGVLFGVGLVGSLLVGLIL